MHVGRRRQHEKSCRQEDATRRISDSQRRKPSSGPASAMVVARHTLNTVFGEQGRVRLPDAGGPLDLSPLRDVPAAFLWRFVQWTMHEWSVE
jgi:hypothetical protein